MDTILVERQIIRLLRVRLREYFPALQGHIDQKIITKYDWIFFGIVQLSLVKCFLATPEKAIADGASYIVMGRSIRNNLDYVINELNI